LRSEEAIVRKPVAALLVLSGGILIGGCKGQAPSSQKSAAAAAPASTVGPATTATAPIESRPLEDTQATTAVMGDMAAEPLPPELAEHIPNFVIRLSRLWPPGQVLRVCFFD
jgi:hypothetical protein